MRAAPTIKVPFCEKAGVILKIQQRSISRYFNKLFFFIAKIIIYINI